MARSLRRRADRFTQSVCKIGGRMSLVRHITLVGVIMMLAASALAQSHADAAVPQTAWGHPDLQGVWDFRTLTPLERPAELADKKFLTKEEAAAFEQQTLDERNADRRDGAERAFGIGADVERAYNQFWWDYGTTVTEDKRTSLVVVPANGRIPYTEDGQA